MLRFMIEKEVIVQSEKGLRARPVSKLIKKAMAFQSKIDITYNDKKADAKSLINVLALKVPNGAKINISASGDDEALALDELVKIVASLE